MPATGRLAFRHRLTHRIAGIAGETRQYSATYLSLLREIFKAHPKRLTVTIIATVAGAGITMVALMLLLQAVNAVEAGVPLEVMGWTILPYSQRLLTQAVILITVTLVAGAGLTFLSKRSILKMAAGFGMQSMATVATIYGGQPPGAGAWINDKALHSALSSLQNRDARLCSLAIRRLLEQAASFTVIVIGFLALFWLHTTATLIILALLAPAGWFYYRVNLMAARSTRQLEEANPRAGRATRDLLATFAARPGRQIDPSELKDVPQVIPVREAVNAFGGRFAALFQSEFISYLVMAISLAVLLLYMGRNAAAGEILWAPVLVYLLILRIAMGSMRTLFQTLATLSRYYPAVYRYRQFMASADTGDDDKAVTRLELKTAEDGISEYPERKRTVTKGQVIGLTAPVTPSRYTVRYLASVLGGPRSKARGGGLAGAITIAAPLAPPPIPVPLRDLLALPKTWDADELRSRLGTEADEVEKLTGSDPDRPLSPQEWKALSAAARRKLVLVGAEASTRPVLMIQEKLVTPQWLEEHTQWLADRIVFVCSLKPPPAEPRCQVSLHVVSAADGSIVGMGSPRWVRDNWDRMKELLQARVATLRGTQDEPTDEEDEAGEGF